MKKECRDIQKKLSAFRDGELDPEAKTAVEAHLDSCEACRSRDEALAKTYQMIQSLPEIEPGQDFLRKVMDRTGQGREPYWIKGIRLVQEFFPMPAAMAALAVSGILIGAVSGTVLTRQWALLALRRIRAGRPLLSLNAFEAIPPGSFAGDVLKLADFHGETEHEK
nr:hypothetical protein [Desulfobacula sp.]